MTKKGLPILSAREIIKILSKAGFSPHSQRGSHIKLKKKLDAVGSITVIVPNHKEVEKGTLNEILKQTKITKEEFLELMNK